MNIWGHSRADTPFSLALILPHQGASAMYLPSCFAAAQSAAAEVNSRGGVGGRLLELHLLDGSSQRGPYLDALARGAQAGTVDAVTGVHPSFVRETVRRVLDGRVPYLYPSVWEGGPRSPGLLCTGETPQDQALPAIRWITRNAAVRRWMIVGDDYIWPRITARYLARELTKAKGWAGTHLASYDALESEQHRDEVIDDVLDRIESSGADGVVMLFVGDHGALFNRSFAARGLDASILRFSPLMDENMLLASGPDSTRGLLSAANYANGMTTPEAAQFHRDYETLHGAAAPIPNVLAVALYDSIRIITQLAQLTPGGTLTSQELEQAVDTGFVYHGPRGEMRVRGARVWQESSLYIADGCGFVELARLN